MSEHQKDDNNNITLLNIYYDEWKYRLDNFRKQIYKLIVVIFFTTTLPITINLFNEIKLPNVSLYVFPITGFLLTIIFVFYCLAEATRIASLDKKIKLIIKNHCRNEYCKDKLEPILGKKSNKFFEKKMTVWMPLALALLEVILVATMIYLITTNSLIM